jgi:hypothetical protein
MRSRKITEQRTYAGAFLVVATLFFDPVLRPQYDGAPDKTLPAIEISMMVALVAIADLRRKNSD